ncbi:hypothetical protein SPLC1_S010670 [Arthrospira platensis C1]|nr:hypothetical protein SPLC1_S010670 [Arthrospira platensis C1]
MLNFYLSKGLIIKKYVNIISLVLGACQPVGANLSEQFFKN